MSTTNAKPGDTALEYHLRENPTRMIFPHQAVEDIRLLMSISSRLQSSLDEVSASRDAVLLECQRRTIDGDRDEREIASLSDQLARVTVQRDALAEELATMVGVSRSHADAADAFMAQVDTLRDALVTISDCFGHEDEQEWDSMQGAWQNGYENANHACGVIARAALATLLAEGGGK